MRVGDYPEGLILLRTTVVASFGPDILCLSGLASSLQLDSHGVVPCFSNHAGHRARHATSASLSNLGVSRNVVSVWF